MSQTLVQWLVALGKDPGLVVRFEQNPDQEMAAFGLTGEDREVLRTRNLHQLRTALVNKSKEKPRPIVIGIGF